MLTLGDGENRYLSQETNNTGTSWARAVPSSGEARAELYQAQVKLGKLDLLRKKWGFPFVRKSMSPSI